MAMIHDVPGEFNNETKWLKYFGNKQLVLITIGGAITYLNFKFLGLFGLAWLGVILGIIITLFLVVPSMIPIQETEFLSGGGLTFDQKLFRIILRNSQKAIYIRGWGKNEETEKMEG